MLKTNLQLIENIYLIIVSILLQVTVDAMEQLLKSCHGSPSLNQFIANYLLMVQRLLETNNPHMEKLATGWI